MKINPAPMSRRRAMGVAVQLAAAIPIVALFSREAFAANNAVLRKALQYQDTPKGDAKCANCIQFVAGKSATDKGQCKAIPGDDEIAPTGWCAAFAAKPK